MAIAFMLARIVTFPILLMVSSLLRFHIALRLMRIRAMAFTREGARAIMTMAILAMNLNFYEDIVS